MPEFVLEAFESTVTMGTSATMATSSIPTLVVSAQSVITVDLDVIKSVFKFQTDTGSDEVKYYIYDSNFPSINAANAMMDHTASVDPIASGFAANKMMVCHDFVRYLALRLFGTHQAVDLFNNETALLQNLRTSLGSGSGNAIGTILTALAAVGTSGTASGIATDGNGDKYMTNSTTANTNIGRELFQQLSSVAASRFASLTDSNSKQSFPFLEDDIISFKVTINAANNQHNLTSVDAIPSRSYKIKLLMKETANVSNTAVDSNEE